MSLTRSAKLEYESNCFRVFNERIEKVHYGHKARWGGLSIQTEQSVGVGASPLSFPTQKNDKSSPGKPVLHIGAARKDTWLL